MILRHTPGARQRPQAAREAARYGVTTRGGRHVGCAGRVATARPPCASGPVPRWRAPERQRSGSSLPPEGAQGAVHRCNVSPGASFNTMEAQCSVLRRAGVGRPGGPDGAPV